MMPRHATTVWAYHRTKSRYLQLVTGMIPIQYQAGPNSIKGSPVDDEDIACERRCMFALAEILGPDTMDDAIATVYREEGAK